MSRQIEIDFFTNAVASENTESRSTNISTDLFGSMDASFETEMNLEREKMDKSVKITAQVSDLKNDIFGS